MTSREALLTTDQFEAFIAKPENADQRYELIEGEIVQKAMPTRKDGRIAARFVKAFAYFADTNPAVFVDVAVEARHRPTGDSHNDRIPDVSIVLEEKPELEQGVEDYIPDICIEIQSPDDKLVEMREKAAFYIEHGAKFALIVTTKQKEFIEVYAPGEDVVILYPEDTLTFDDLLPGFSVPVARFFGA